jgi:carboxymethylenebutenolidase
MTELQRYLAEEVAEDHADGIITRREAMRRLALLGLGATAASALLAACGSDADAGSSSGSAGATTAGAAGRAAQTGDSAGVETWAPVPTRPITFQGPRGTLLGAYAAARRPRGSVLVIHENRGLTDHIRQVAGRFAADGFSALALDLLSEEGGTAKVGDEAQVAAALSQIDPARFDADMKAAVSELRRRVRGRKVAVTGFCFGGGMVWRLLAAGEGRVAAAAPFYGPFPDGGDLRRAKAAVLAIYGGLDARVGATRPAAQAAMRSARLDNQVVVFGGADHAFFNDTGARFNPPAAAEAYRRVIDWFERNAA